jgi:hypothetical protein
MGDIGFWLFLIFFVAVANIDEIGNAFKEGCTPVAEERSDGTE